MLKNPVKGLEGHTHTPTPGNSCNNGNRIMIKNYRTYIILLLALDIAPLCHTHTRVRFTIVVAKPGRVRLLEKSKAMEVRLQRC